MPDTQYFTNIDGKYVKDAEARQQLNDLEDYVESLDQPWQPLQDGYSNFWFELTNDTLSPWLNFSAKNNDATIDWGDGSGEVALDTLTPTHTYSKAGKYVVKVKGVTGIARQYSAPYTAYASVLKYVELNNEIASISQNGFFHAHSLVDYEINSATVVNAAAFANCVSLKKAILTTNAASVYATNYSLITTTIDQSLTEIGASAFSNCMTINQIILPSSIATIGNNVFSGDVSLSEIHVQATNPPTLGSSVFYQLPTNYIIYVPVGYGDTYKAAEGWSAYADHILEEGETPTRAMVAKFNAMKTDEPQDDMR